MLQTSGWTEWYGGGAGGGASHSPSISISRSDGGCWPGTASACSVAEGRRKARWPPRRNRRERCWRAAPPAPHECAARAALHCYPPPHDCAQTHARHRPVWFVLRRTVTHAQELMMVVVLLQPRVEVIQLHNAGTKEVILQTRLLVGAVPTHAQHRLG